MCPSSCSLLAFTLIIIIFTWYLSLSFIQSKSLVLCFWLHVAFCHIVKTKRDVSLGDGCMVHHSKYNINSSKIHLSLKLRNCVTFLMIKNRNSSSNTVFVFVINTMKNSTTRRKQLKPLRAVVITQKLLSI